MLILVFTDVFCGGVGAVDSATFWWLFYESAACSQDIGDNQSLYSYQDLPQVFNGLGHVSCGLCTAGYLHYKIIS